MTESQQLLTEYAESGSEEAFRELVRRYIDFVYSTARRLTGGDAHSAQDITQTVFIHLCRNARKLSRDAMLGGWLHRDTCYVASKVQRQERRRQAREQQAVFMESLQDHSQANLERIAPILDEAINSLGNADRTAILLRFFEKRDFRSVGLALDSNEDAARMRVTRALDKLHSVLKRRGVTLSVSALAPGLAGEAVTAAPVGLAASVAGSAIAASAGVGGISTGIIKVLTMTKLKMAVAGVVLAGGLAIPVAIQHRSQLLLREENRQLQQRVKDLMAANSSLSNRVSQVSGRPAHDPNQERELLKLRGEVGSLKRQLVDAGKAQAAKPAGGAATENEQNTSEEQNRQVAIAKMTYTKAWMLAFFMYSQSNQGRFPTNFNQAVSFWPSDVPGDEKGTNTMQPDGSTSGTTQYGLVPDNYDIVYQGSINTLTNPQSIIVIREKDAWQAPDGGWVRAYAFADGHSEIHRADDGNFLPWEQQHMTSAQQ
jgi:RNA polymerase sigma factor (sigma-70 family)